MTTAEERLRILTMIQEGKITAEEGTRLLEALGSRRQAADEVPHARSAAQDNRLLHVRITDLDTGSVKVNVNIPMRLVHVGIKLGARFLPNNPDVDFDQIMQAVNEGASGQLVDVEDLDSGEHIEVWVG